MTVPSPDAEASLESATLALFAELGWETVDAYHEIHGAGPEATLGREHRIRRVISVGGLRDRGRWPEIQERMVDAMVRLERALKPEIRRLE